ncbi:hypothetical protein PVK06_023220 [Gossypium arboreum]|uniref:Uncharacterized protein n=1 Tax=Gossypium arboreum TaxID=29729 RepID=A0ABR0PAI0_GOSAR|nr:hypothetical protein PVK06_023220 [Gossypium arboreum]
MLWEESCCCPELHCLFSCSCIVKPGRLLVRDWLTYSKILRFALSSDLVESNLRSHRLSICLLILLWRQLVFASLLLCSLVAKVLAQGNMLPNLPKVVFEENLLLLGVV